jgi:hypothetical protein
VNRIAALCVLSCVGSLAVIGLLTQSARAQSGLELRRIRTEENALGLPVRQSGSDAKTNYGPAELGNRAGERAPNDLLQPDPVTRTASLFAPPAVAAPSGTLSFSEIFRSLEVGHSIGSTGLATGDVDGDGQAEILSGGYDSWVLLAWSASKSEYVPRLGKSVSVSYYDEGFSFVDLVRIGSAWRILTMRQNGVVEIEDALTGAVTASVSGLEEITHGAFGDADNDGQPDVVAFTTSAVLVLDPATLATRHSYPFGVGSYGYGQLAIGNVDDDPANEIVLNTGPILEASGDTAKSDGSVPTNIFAGSGYERFILADFDGDGRSEVITAGGWNRIPVFDAALGAVEWTITTNLDVAAVQFADVTGDGRREVLYGDGQWGAIHALDTVTRSEIWSVPNPNHGVTKIAVADTDGDGTLEVVWGAGYTSSGEDTLYVASVATRAIEWASTEADGPYRAVAAGDIDGDGGSEFVAFSTESRSGYDDGIGFAWDAATLEPKWHSGPDLFQGFAWTGIWDTAVGDVDGDGAPEIVVGTDRLYDGAVYVFDGATKRRERVSYYDSGSPIYDLSIDDLEGNGSRELVLLSGIAHTGSPGVFATATNGATGGVLWKSPQLSPVFSYPSSLEVADFDGDGARDIAVVTQGRLWIINGVTHAGRPSAVTNYQTLAAADFDGDGKATLWAANSAGMISQIDVATLAATPRGEVCAGGVNALVADAAGALPGTLVFTCADELGIFGIYENTVLWRSGPLQPQLAGNDNIAIVEIGNRARIAVGDYAGVRVFEGYGTRNLDIDGDGAANYLDNCPEVANPSQADTDGDHVGDACNDASDADGDEWADARDVCPGVADPGQADSDGDRVGNACNDASDPDGDEWADALDDCPELANPGQANFDGDELGDACDPYPDNPDNYRARCEEAVANEAELRAELAVCQAQGLFTDEDGDGEADRTDACPHTKAGAEVDSAGCSLAQFCPRDAPRVGFWWVVRCIRLDWKNNEPETLLPDDCQVSKMGSGRVCVGF